MAPHCRPSITRLYKTQATDAVEYTESSEDDLHIIAVRNVDFHQHNVVALRLYGLVDGRGSVARGREA